MKKKNARNKKVKEDKKTDEIDYEKMDYSEIINLLSNSNDEYLNILSKRNYLQQEKDIIEKLNINTKKNFDKEEKKLLLIENKYQKICEDHEVELRTFQQKIKQLDFENEKNLLNLELKEHNDLESEKEYLKKRILDLKNEKNNLKDKYDANLDENLKDLEEKKKKHFNNLKSAKNDFTRALLEYEDKNEKNLKELRDDLKLKIKTEIHEIEERKNYHINELIKNHDKAFEELKSFYNYITSENLNLVRAQKEELNKRQKKHNENLKKINTFKDKNKELEINKEKAQKALSKLKYI